MAILSVDEHWDSRATDSQAKFQRTHTRRFLVIVDDTDDYGMAILAHASIPANLAVHPTDSDAQVKSRKVSNDSQFHEKWWADITYDTWWDDDPDTYADIPTDRPAIVDWTFEKATKAVQYDVDDDAIENSAGVPISPPLEIDLSLPVATVLKNYVPGAIPALMTFQDTVNSDEYTLDGQTFQPGQVKVRGITIGKKQKQNGVLFVPVTWQLAIKYDGWRPHRVLDCGFSELVAGEWKTIRNASGPLPQPSRLDGSGLRLAPGDPPVYLSFALNRELSFVGAVP